MATRFSWKRGKSYEGLRRLPNTYRLSYGGAEIAVAQEARDGLWFWYGGGQNTAHALDCLENVKAQAVQHFKKKHGGAVGTVKGPT